MIITMCTLVRRHVDYYIPHSNPSTSFFSSYLSTQCIAIDYGKVNMIEPYMRSKKGRTNKLTRETFSNTQQNNKTGGIDEGDDYGNDDDNTPFHHTRLIRYPIRTHALL